MGGNLSQYFLAWLLIILNERFKIAGHVCTAVKVNVGNSIACNEKFFFHCKCSFLPELCLLQFHFKAQFCL